MVRSPKSVKIYVKHLETLGDKLLGFHLGSSLKAWGRGSCTVSWPPASTIGHLELLYKGKAVVGGFFCEGVEGGHPVRFLPRRSSITLYCNIAWWQDGRVIPWSCNADSQLKTGVKINSFVTWFDIVSVQLYRVN